MRFVKWSLWDANDFCVAGGWAALQFCTFDLHIQECPPSQPPRLIAARIRLRTSRCRVPSHSLCSWTSREKRRQQCLWNFLNVFTNISFIITPNSSLDSAWIAAQESEAIVTAATNCREYLILNMGVLCSPMHKRLKTGPLRMNSRYPYGTLVALRMLPRQMSSRSDTFVWPALQTRWRFVGV